MSWTAAGGPKHAVRVVRLPRASAPAQRVAVQVVIHPTSGDVVAVLLTPIEVPGDLDGDCIVGVLDLLSLLGAWGPCEQPCPPACTADIDGDCNVGVLDLFTVLANWSYARRSSAPS